MQYDCLGAVFQFNNVSYSWWNDRDGEPQYFWTGDSHSQFSCSCGVNGTCVDETLKCNCDSSLAAPLMDEGRFPYTHFDLHNKIYSIIQKGTITDKKHLPVTRLNFGRTSSIYSKGEHTLGPLRCSGLGRRSEMPSSCKELWIAGHKLSALYQVQLTNDYSIATVWCDMSKLPDEKGNFSMSKGFVVCNHD